MSKRFYRSIVMSKTPLQGFFRCGDEFQIFPCDLEHIPKSKYTEDFPLFLEFWIIEGDNQKLPEDLTGLESILSPITKMSNKGRKICRLLTAITNHKFTFLGDSYPHWGVKLPEVIPNDYNPTSEIFHEFFIYPQLANDCKITEFSEQRHQDIDRIGSGYFSNDPIDSKNKVISFHKSIDFILPKYFGLNDEERAKVNTVAHLISNGIELKPKMKSLAFLSFISAIETLMNYEYKDEEIKACKMCGQQQFLVNKKFQMFLKTYLSREERHLKMYKAMYSLRSKIIHRGSLLFGDEEIDWSKSQKADSEFQTSIHAMQFSRLALVHWLLKGPKLAFTEERAKV